MPNLTVAELLWLVVLVFVALFNFWMLVDSIKHRKYLWAFIVFIFTPGALIYYLTEYRKHKKENN